MNDDPEESVVGYADARFELRPHPKYRDLVRLTTLAEEMGYEMPFSTKQYSLEDVQEILRTEGASAFLKITRLQEDISPKASPRRASEYVAQRLARLGPTTNLMITDPYLFPPKPNPDVAQYARNVSALIVPLLADGAKVTAVVNRQANRAVESALRLELLTESHATLVTIKSEDFHDRFWIADRSRGVIVGASLNGLGGRIFFIDALRDSDVSAVVRELEALGL